MEGTATISLDTLDELRKKAEEAETEKKRSGWFVKKLMNCYGFDTEAYDKALKEIDNIRDLTDKQCSKLVREAMVKHLKIVIDQEELKELIQEYIDEEASDEHLDIAKASAKELKQIQIVMRGGAEEGEKPDKNLCEMCQEYMAETECDYLQDGSCPAAVLMKRAKEAEKAVKAKEDTIKRRDKTIRELKKKLDESELKRSYMVDPMAIGDRHEMGG